MAYYHHKLRTTQPEGKEEVLHFSLQGLLPAGHTLALSPTWGILTLLGSNGDHPYVLYQEPFTTSEVYVILPLLEAYPYHCPNETLYASFQYRSVSESTIARSRNYLHEARETGIWDQEMRLVRNALSRARIKLRTFGIEILSIHETGYMLLRRETYETKTG